MKFRLGEMIRISDSEAAMEYCKQKGYTNVLFKDWKIVNLLLFEKAYVVKSKDGQKIEIPEEFAEFLF